MITTIKNRSFVTSCYKHHCNNLPLMEHTKILHTIIHHICIPLYILVSNINKAKLDIHSVSGEKRNHGEIKTISLTNWSTKLEQSYSCPWCSLGHLCCILVTIKQETAIQTALNIPCSNLGIYSYLLVAVTYSFEYNSLALVYCHAKHRGLNYIASTTHHQCRH